VKKGMNIFKEERAQGSIELLILIAGAVVVASIVGVLLKQAATRAAESAEREAGTAASP
jgi:uncharacterized protein (UPF0333 family)